MRATREESTSVGGADRDEKGGTGSVDPASRARRRGMTSVGEWLRSIVIALLLFVFIRATVVEAFKIPTSSMEGTLLVGDFLFVNKAVYGARVPGTSITLPPFEEPGHGDVVVFHPPHEPDKNYVKRVVGVGADTLEMRDKVLYLNGVTVDEPYTRFMDRRGDAAHPDMEWQSHHLIAAPPRAYQPTRDNWGPIVVPEEHYFVLGDNRDNSEDSRYWGFVARDQVRGKPWMVYYSFQTPEDRSKGWLHGVRWSRIGARIR